MKLHVPIGRRKRRPMIISLMLACLILGFLCDAAEIDNSSTSNNTATTKTGTGSCTPSNCVARCSPSCGADQVCIMGTMSSCGVCPASQCVSRSVLGGSSSPSSPTTSTPGSDSNDDSSSSSTSSGANNGSLIGGLVGGLVGAGLVLSAAGYAGFRYKQKKNTLPFAFHGKSGMSQQQRQPPPPPSAPAMSMVAAASPPTTTAIMNDDSNESSRQQVMSGVIPIAYIPPSRQSSEHVYNRPANTIEEQQQQYDNAVAQTSYPRYNKFLSQSFRKSDLQRQSTATALTAADDNPFSDDHHSRNSVLTTDDERASIASSVAHVTKTPVKATQAYQMQRAKPQIMRVNTVRVNNGAGLTRSGSTRTVLTRDSTQLSRSNTAPTRHQQQQQQTEKQQQNPGEENGQQQHVPVQLADVEQRPSSAPAAQLNDEDDPFHDRHSATNASSASSSSEKLRPQITDSMVSGPSDGEITIFWDAHRSTQSLSPASFPKPPQSP